MVFLFEKIRRLIPLIVVPTYLTFGMYMPVLRVSLRQSGHPLPEEYIQVTNSCFRRTHVI